ncbi:hypothetical protein PoB_004984200 [Plakobranchus ocellatus]|uniref:C2H2-type domain-containing protein n=1 Tax=Plakobranchus ocellatus TaxID=259542 RepID=A0AAV4BVH0_9GAST|nr:hypothetical protein PoB_004984200 [Plakobranchus ocellatus]
MSDHSEELVGDADDLDLEADVDFSEWASMGEDCEELFPSKLPKTTLPTVSTKQKPQLPQKEPSYKPPATSQIQNALQKIDKTPRKQNNITMKGSSNNTTPKSASILNSAQTTNISKATGLSDIAGAIQSLGPHDSASNLKHSNSKENLQQHQNTANTIVSLKRKTDVAPGTNQEEAKSRKRDQENDILMAIGDADSNNKSASNPVEDRDKSNENLLFSSEELQKLDSSLVNEMMAGVKKQMFLRMAKGDRYVVTFSPVELADLAQESLQDLIESQPNLAFFFNRQGRFKKKKGYAQAYFTLTSEVREFIHKLIYVKLSEQCTEVSVSAIMNGGKNNVQVSFALSSNNKGKLLELLKIGEDPLKNVPTASKVSLQIDKVSTEATSSVLILLFPFASSINFNPTQTKDVGAGYKGLVDVYYLTQEWMDAVMACCSDFKYNGLPVTFVKNKKQKSDVVQEPSPVQQIASDLRKSAESDQPQIETSAGRGGANNSERSRHASSNSNKSGSDNADDDISNMTLDVCAGMMESLDKLKQIGTDNPNVLRILEMQSQLAQLQKSLTKKTKQGSAKSSQDPSTTNNLSGELKGKEVANKLSKEERNKQIERVREEKNKREVEILEAKLQEADQKEKDREEHVKRQLEEEKQRAREFDEKRKSSCAKEMLEEARQKWSQGETRSEAAQKILQSIEERRRDEREVEGELSTADQKMRKSDTRNVPDSGNPSNSESTRHDKSRDGRLQSSSEDWNPAGIQDLGTMSFQDKFQPMASFLENLPGKSTNSRPPVSGPRPSTWAGGSERPGGSAGHHQKRKSDEDGGLHSRLEKFQEELAQKGVVSPVKVGERWRSTVSPDRPLCEGVPVYTEKEYQYRKKAQQGRGFPQEFFIQTTFLPNRRCPVQGCPAAKVFKTEPMFLDHWDMFHKPTMTMRFCHRCSAYFVHTNELHAHLMKAHNISDSILANKMVAEARMKSVSNPSYRDPGKFLAPPV